MSTSHINVLYLGDIIGKPGRRAVREYSAQLSPRPDIIVANVENLAHGFGVSQSTLTELKEMGVDIFSGGNHTFDRKEIFEFIDQEPYLLRPANYPEGTAGKGYCILEKHGIKFGVINVLGRVFMEPLRSPFLVADELITQIAKETNLILLDIHAEATAEKIALGFYVDGRVSAVVGSHTHVQTADEKILAKGTGYLTDAGCCGPYESVIGMDSTNVLRRFIEQVPARFEVAEGAGMVNGVIFKLDITTGKTMSVSRVFYKETP